MAVTLFLAAIVSLTFLLFGLAKPKKVFLGLSSTRGKVVRVYGLSFIALFVAFMLVLPEIDGVDQAEPKHDFHTDTPTPRIVDATLPTKADSEPAHNVGISTPSQPIDKTTPPEIADAKSANPVSTIPPTEPAASTSGPATAEVLLQEHLGIIDKALRVASVKQAEENSVHITLHYSPSSTWSEALYVFAVANNLLSAGKKIKDSEVNVSSVTLISSAPSVDKYGNESSSEAMTLTLTGDEFSKVNWGNIGTLELLNVVDVDFTQFGRAAAIEFCKEKRNLQRAMKFCLAALN